MQEHHVTWEIDVPAEDPVSAAREALAIQRDPHSTATVFYVDGERVDLGEIDEDLRKAGL